MTEAELREIFGAVAGRYLARPDVGPDAADWIDQRIAEAASRAAGDPRLSDPAAAAIRAEQAFARLFPNPPAPPGRVGIRAPALITADDLAAFPKVRLPWPFGDED